MNFSSIEIDLARQLALPREFRPTDWVIGRGRYAGPTGAWADWSDPYPIHGDAAVLANRGVEGAEWVWLPSLDDCCELLREAERQVNLSWVGPATGWAASIPVTAVTMGATPREALYRLLLEVRG